MTPTPASAHSKSTPVPGITQCSTGFRFRLATRSGAAALASLLAFASPVAAADEATAEADADIIGRSDIIVIGTVDRLLDIAGSGSLITAQALERSRVFTVNEALRQVPGLFPRDEEGLGARPNIGVRGLNPTRSSKVLLLEDGIPLAFAPYGDNASYYHPPIERFDRIEVLKGASQIRFGPQTIGGVINYITPAAPMDPMARIRITGGNRDTLMLDALAGGPALGGRVLIHANHKASDGARENHRLRFTDVSAKGEWDLTDRQSLTLKLSWFQEDSQVSYSGLTRAEFAAEPRGNPFPNDRFTAKRLSATAAHGLDLDDGVKLLTTGYYHHFDRDWWRQSSNSGQRPNDASDPACGGMINLSTTCGNEGRLRTYDTWGVETRLTLDHALFFGGSLEGSTELGLRYHREEQSRLQWNSDSPTGRTPGTGVNAGVRENNAREARALSAFVQSSLDFGRFSLQPGIRAEFIDYDRRSNPTDIRVGGKPSGAVTTPTSGSASLDQIIPGLGATFDLSPDISLYAGVHRGFAPPRVEDIITASGGSVDLGPELSWNTEAGLRGRLMPGLRGDATIFLMDFENQIIPASVAGGVGATLTSAGRTTHRGGELSLAFSSQDAALTGDTDIFARTAITWIQTARYASTRITTPPCFDGATTGTPVETGSGSKPCGIRTDVEGNRLAYSPEWLWSAAVGASVSGFTGQFEVVGQSAMFADDANLVAVTPDGQRGRIGGWATLNLALSYGQGNWEVFATAKNLFDKLFVADRSRGILPGTPRLLQAGVGFSF